MEWYVGLLIMFGSLVVLMTIGVPVAFSFLMLNLIWGLHYFGASGIDQGVMSMYSNLNTFILVPIPLFILMGEIMFHSGIGPVLIRTLDKWIGRVPGRLSILAVAAGTLFAALTGTSLASVALPGRRLAPRNAQAGLFRGNERRPYPGQRRIGHDDPPQRPGPSWPPP